MSTRNEELTTVQKKALLFVQAYIEEHGKPPSIRVLGEHLGCFVSSAAATLKRLQDKGFLEKKAQRITEVRLRLSVKGRKAL